MNTKKVSYRINEDGTYTRKIEECVELMCMKYSGWNYIGINSETALSSCPRRKCGNAYEEDISDIFTQLPGLFDDMITIDKVLDFGYTDTFKDGIYTVYKFDFEYDTYAYVNELGIVDFFTVFCGSEYRLRYSKKYNKLFTTNRRSKHHTEWNPATLIPSTIDTVRKDIAKLYE
jgi:hypothetical protein